jgi:putative endonuclease
MFHVYVIISLSTEGRYYIGFAKDVQHRLEEHNAGKNPSTAPFAPWSVGAIVSFPSKTKALEFERYLKGGSGRAFLRKHLI